MPTDIKAHITGNVWRIEVKEGDHVDEGDTLIIFESMKMEIPLEVEDPGTVVAVRVAEGDAVNEGQVVVQLEED